MKAIVLRNQTELVEEEVPKPKPKANEVLIQVKASGFNPIDYQMLENELERKLIKSPILGRELAGIIVEVGEMVSSWKVGDEIYCSIGSMGSNGSYAEYVTAPTTIIALKPKKISFEAAAVIPSVGITALQIFNRLQGNWNKQVLIIGASGGVGSFLIQILNAHSHLESIIATYGSQNAYCKLKRLGLHDTQLMNYNDANWYRSYENTGGIDLVVDLVGCQLSEIAATMLKVNGVYVDVTALTSTTAREILFNKGIVIINISNYAYAASGNYSYYQNSLQQLTQWFDENKLYETEFEVIGNLSLQTILTAHQKLKNNQTNAKKLAMTHIL